MPDHEAGGGGGGGGGGRGRERGEQQRIVREKRGRRVTTRYRAIHKSARFFGQPFFRANAASDAPSFR